MQKTVEYLDRFNRAASGRITDVTLEKVNRNTYKFEILKNGEVGTCVISHGELVEIIQGNLNFHFNGLV